MYKIVAPIGKLISVKHFTKSDTIFLLNTKITTAILVGFSVLLTAMELHRTSIDCFTDGTDKRKALMDNYCWSIGTFICKNHRNGKEFFLRFLRDFNAGSNESRKITVVSKPPRGTRGTLET